MPSNNKPQITNFGKTFISYGSYHYNLVNKIIHIFCVPVIAATMIAMLSFIPFRVDVYGHQVGIQHFFIAFAMVYYLLIGISAFVVMGIAFAMSYYLWQFCFEGADIQQIRNWIIIINVVGWGLQFIGHGVFQKRKPALLDNLFQILSAPLFVIIQIAMLCGLMTDEMKIWNEQIQKNVMQFRNSKKSA